MSSIPSKPIPIASPNNKPSNNDANQSVSGRQSPAQATTPDLRALRARYAATPPLPPIPPFASTANTPPNLVRRQSSSALPGSLSVSVTGSDAPAPINDIDDLPNEEKAKVLRRHLVSRQERLNKLDNKDLAPDVSDDSLNTAQAGASTHSSPHGSSVFPGTSGGAVLDDDESFPVPYDAHGGDVTHSIYKWHSNATGVGARRRSISYSGQRAPRDPAFEHIHQPGGFRRNYMLLKADEHGNDEPRVVNNFIEFLYLFGHFAGEDLEEIEEEDEEDIERTDEGRTQSLNESDTSSQGLVHRPAKKSSRGRSGSDEATPLLTQDMSASFASGMSLKRSMSRRRTRGMSVSARGDASVLQAVLMMLKSFVGTGVLFLGKAFYNGGLLFSAVTVCGIALISLYSFLLLTDVKWVVGGSFGDMGGTLYGPRMRFAILFSIAISQIGFVTAYMIFVSSNLQTLILTLTNCRTLVPSSVLIFSQLIMLFPLAMIRNLARLSLTALVADAFILVGLCYIWGQEAVRISVRGIADVKLFNPNDFALLIGTAVFSFEGVGLVIPVTDAMREPRKFPAVLSGVMIFLLFLFSGSGALAYLAFGSEIQPTVIINLPQDSRFVQVVQLIYSIAILLSIPIQLFPALRIMENALITKSGKADNKVKWEKNAFRFVVVIGCAFISWAGSSDLDKFVAFVGSFACLPLCFIYPAMLHLKACAHTTSARVKDWAVLVFGVVVAVFSCVQTVRLAIRPETGPPPPLGMCS